MFLKNIYKKGFTLIEMVVSLAIVTAILTVVLFNYSSFTSNLALSSAAQELAITIRQAQVYGLIVREVAPGGGNFQSAYGIYIDKVANTGYVIFADTNNNKIYNNPGELIQSITFRDGIKISDVNNGTANSPSGSSRIHVTFLRPNPDARIYFTDSSGTFIGNTPPTSGYTTGKIVLISPSGKTLTITIQNTGGVSIGTIS